MGISQIMVNWLTGIPMGEPGSETGISEPEFLELLESYRDEFYRFIYRKTWNSSDVDDVFSEAIMVAWEKRDSFRKGSNFRAWFYRILLNKSYVFNRHTGRHAVSTDAPDSPELSDEVEEGGDHSAFSDPSDFLDKLDDSLFEAIHELRESERVCLCLRAIDNCSYKEIAEIMDIPIGTVMTHLSRSRKKVQKFLLTRAS